MILAAHQANFLPWLGFFDKMIKADVFVVVDHVQFERQGFQNRASIKTGQGPSLVVVPVRQHSRKERMQDKLIDNTGQDRHRWGHRVGKTIKYAYQGAPFFSEYILPFIEVFDARWERLIDLNLELIELCRHALDIKTPIKKSSELNVMGRKSDMLIGLCQTLGADTYLSGAGGAKKYLDENAFGEAGVHIEWQDFCHPIYPQHPTPERFIEKLSVLDLLANCGPQSRVYLERKLPKGVGRAMLRNFPDKNASSSPRTP